MPVGAGQRHLPPILAYISVRVDASTALHPVLRRRPCAAVVHRDDTMPSASHIAATAVMACTTTWVSLSAARGVDRAHQGRLNMWVGRGTLRSMTEARAPMKDTPGLLPCRLGDIVVLANHGEEAS